jgi:polyisoprenyl-phosphate glycosyltransferase
MHIAIVIPVFCEEKNIQPLYERLEIVCASLHDVQWEYIFVNDGSRDRTFEALKDLAQRDPKVKVLDFSKNFGKEIALSAGVHAANADAVICMDADLQHPPELIPEMVEAWRRGADVVVAVRQSIAQQPLMRRLGSYFYYRLMSTLSGLDVVPGTTDFRLIDRKVTAIFRGLTERVRMFRSLIDWMGFKKELVYFHAEARQEGKTSFSYHRLWDLAITSITSFSLLPLRLTAYFGMAITAGSGFLLTYMLLAKVFPSIGVFTPLAIVVVINTLLMGIVMMSVGMVALYIGTIHTEVINRPLYIVRHRLNLTDPSRSEGSQETAGPGRDI